MAAKHRSKAVSLAVFFSCSAVFSATYYVASNGSDGAAGTLAAPYLTIQKAAGKMAAGDTCLIRSGIYRETVVPANSGASGNPIVFMAYQGENVFISAADPVTGAWTKDAGSIYKTQISWDMGKGRNALFHNGQEVLEARYPKLDAPESQCGRTEYSPLYMRGGDPAHFGVCPVNAPFLVGGTEGGQENPDGRLSGTVKMWVQGTQAVKRPFFDSCRAANAPQDFLAGAVVQKGGGWFIETGIVVPGWGVDGNGMYVNVSIKQGESWYFGGGCYFIFTGARSLLYQPGEWVLANGTLYFWPPGGQDPSTSGAVIEMKRRQLVMDLSNRSYIEARGLRFLGGSIQGIQTNNCIIDGCYGRYITHWTLIPEPDMDTTNHKTGEFGVCIIGKNNTIRNSAVEYSAMSGITVFGDGNLITNCLVSNCILSAGLSIGTDRTGLDDFQCPPQHNEASHNTIFNMGRSAMSISSTCLANSNGSQKFLYNDVYNTQMISTDGGSVYWCCGDIGWGTEMAYNWFHDMVMEWNAHHLYFDLGSNGYKIHHNVFWQEFGNAQNNSYCSDMPGEDVVYNNTAINPVTEDLYKGFDLRGVNALWVNNNFDSCGLAAGANCIKNRDFTLKATSMAINKGVKRIDGVGYPLVTAGYTGTIFPKPYNMPDSEIVGQAPDLGAYEYGKPAWKPGHTWGTYSWVYPPTGTGVQASFQSSGGARTIALPRIGLMRDRIRIDAPRQSGCAVSLVDASGRRVAAIRMSAGESRVVKVHGPVMGFLRVESSSAVSTKRVLLIPVD